MINVENEAHKNIKNNAFSLNKKIKLNHDDKENIQTTCNSCLTTQTPLWRKGPLGPKTLCNACGLRWAKTITTTVTTTTSTDKLILSKKNNTNNNTNQIPKVDKRKFNNILLFNRKDFIRQGLYYDSTRHIQQSFHFDLPLHQGAFLIEKQKDFELPPFIHQEKELNLIKSSNHRIPFFIHIRSNIFVERKPQTSQQIICHCIKPSSHHQLGCGDDCINRLLFYECDPKHCPCGTQCSNQRFQRKSQIKRKHLEIFKTESRGWGLRTLVHIKKGDLITEYRGEIISQELCEKRMCNDYVNDQHFYFLDYQHGEVIDATTKGTEARFINHSCDPNCHIEKWSLKGESHFGVFASKDIKPHQELFYDYNFSTFSLESQQKCYCQSKNCRGFIGRKLARK